MHTQPLPSRQLQIRPAVGLPLLAMLGCFTTLAPAATPCIRPSRGIIHAATQLPLHFTRQRVSTSLLFVIVRDEVISISPMLDDIMTLQFRSQGDLTGEGYVESFVPAWCSEVCAQGRV